MIFTQKWQFLLYFLSGGCFYLLWYQQAACRHPHFFISLTSSMTLLILPPRYACPFLWSAFPGCWEMTVAFFLVHRNSLLTGVSASSTLSCCIQSGHSKSWILWRLCHFPPHDTAGEGRLDSYSSSCHVQKFSHTGFPQYLKVERPCETLVRWNVIKLRNNQLIHMGKNSEHFQTPQNNLPNLTK